jgi:sodium/bile acid cotransporter 7
VYNQAVKHFLLTQWFLIALVIMFASGFYWHASLGQLADWTALRNVIVAGCMFLMALPLEASAIWNTLKRPGAIVLAVAVTFGILPLVAWLVSPLLTPDYAGGLLVAAVTPCTMASATVWTRKAGGNDTAATVVTVVSNLICFLTTPSWLWFLLGERFTQATQGLPNFQETVLNLALTVVLPVVAAQVLRMSPPVAEFSRRRRVQLSIASQLAILFMVLLGAVKTGAKLHGEPFDLSRGGELALMIVVVLGLHTSMFWLGLWLARLLGMQRAEQIAVGFAGSQKTLMVGMNVSLGQGFSVLPMVTYHIGQLFIDTLLADVVKAKNSAENRDVSPRG